jgi:hypothetical protein
LENPVDLQQLIDEREISRKLFAFARAMDDREWEAIEGLTTQDTEADVGTGIPWARWRCSRADVTY